MTAIALRSFQGEIPRLPPHLLPDTAAQQASYVNLARGCLAPLRAGSALNVVGVAGWTGGGAAVNSMYTQDGIGWFTDATGGIEYFRSPVIDEQFSRVYFINGGVLKVCSWDPSHIAGGPPGFSWNAGVPTPVNAPTLALLDLTQLPDYPSAAFAFIYWYEKDGVRYQQAAASPTQITIFKQYRFTPAVISGTTPTDAKLVAEVSVTDSSNKLLFRINTSFGASIPSRTQALPGGIELSLSKFDSTQYDILLSWGVVETRAYVYTFVNANNEESAPSPAALISPTYLQSVQVSTDAPVFTGYQSYSTTNVYRTFGGNATYFKIVKTGTNNVWVDAAQQAPSVGVVLSSALWRVPPATMSGLKLMPNGWFVGYNGNTLYMSEPYRPHTWPYSITFPYGIRGICPGAQALVVTTFDETYVVSGSHPASAMSTRLPIPVGGVSQIGICNVEGAIAFISHDGLVLVRGTQATLEFSESLFTRQNWRDRYGTILTSMRLSYHDGFLVASSATPDSVSGEYGFVLRIDEASGMYSRFNKPINTTARLPILDTLYYTTTDDGLGARNVYKFNDGAGTEFTYTWWSKDFVFPNSVKFGAYYMRCNGAVTVTIYADGVQFYSGAVPSTGYFRMPAGEALRWSVKFSGTTAEIYEFVMAQTMGELRGA